MTFIEKVEQLVSEGMLPKELGATLINFYPTYCKAIEQGGKKSEEFHPLLDLFLDHVATQVQEPFLFEPFHRAIREPFDFFQFGMDFIRPLVIMSESKVLGLAHLDRIQSQLKAGENVILFANHQVEPDPQAICLMLEQSHSEIADRLIFVAGHRVTTDPLTVPFSMGCNLLCIFSKKHIENPPEDKKSKLLHNQRTMKRMSELLAEGGKCIYVAPSGGRDRPDENGVVDVAPFDPQSIKMFLLMARQAGHPTHFYPLALSTYHLLPPPQEVMRELGEHREARSTPIHLAFGDEIDMENFPGSDHPDRRTKREHRAQHIWQLVRDLYQQL